MYLMLFSSILVSGTFIFMKLESYQKETKNKLEKELLDLQDKALNSCVTTADTLNKYADLKREYVNFQGGLNSDQAFRLSLSVAFTTGWGTYVPTTIESKVFFLFYSCISIPIATIMLKCIGDIIHEMIFRFVKCIELTVLGRETVKHAYLKSVIVSVAILLLFITLCSYTFTVQGFTILDAVYNCIQCYTTIGFGDLGGESKLQDSSHWTVIGIFLTDMLGMSLLATFINSIVKYHEKSYCKVQRQLRESSFRVMKKINMKSNHSSETRSTKCLESDSHNVAFTNPTFAMDTSNKQPSSDTFE